MQAFLELARLCPPVSEEDMDCQYGAELAIWGEIVDYLERTVMGHHQNNGSIVEDIDLTKAWLNGQDVIRLEANWRAAKMERFQILGNPEAEAHQARGNRMCARKKDEIDRDGQRVRPRRNYKVIVGHMFGDLVLPGSAEGRARCESAAQAEARSSAERRLRDFGFDVRLWKARQHWEVCEMRVMEAEKEIARFEDELEERRGR